jgi:hypothetical protein
MSEEQPINNGIAETVPTEAKCNICGKVLKSAFGLKIHLNSHAPKKAKSRIGIGGHRKRAAKIRREPPAYPRDTLISATSDEPRPTQPWRPAPILHSTNIPGMRPRWVRKDLLDKRIAEGWQPRLSNTNSRLESPDKTIIDGVPLSRYVIKRNMVLCDMPEEMAKSREKYYRDMTDSGLSGTKSEYASQTSIGGQSYGYGDVKVEK